MALRIGVDVGGTFTDVVVYDEESSSTTVTKVPTTPSAPEEGVLAGVREAVTTEMMERAEYFTHGTTVGLNALLERRGSIVGLLSTQGFRDVLEIRRGDRDEMYNIFWRQPEALVPRHLRIPVRERMLADGTEHEALSEADIAAAVPVFADAGVTAVAVAFINAYADPTHELTAERHLRAHGFEGEISLSHRVTREYREYERTSTTAIDAFVRSRMSGYLDRLEQGLNQLGFDGLLLCTRSGGGAMTFEEAAERPFETIMSGPVGGASGAAELSRFGAVQDQVTADVGGTSFDTCVVVDGKPQVLYQGTVAGLPVLTEWVDVRSIGAGGGSVAEEKHGILTVGPRSAGAVPGPAAYGRGGVEPTVTDAAAVLGMFGAGALAANVSLDQDAARTAVAAVADQLGIDVEETARGILAVSTAAMSDAIREITIEQGLDPRTMSLLAIGGAGPLLSCLMAEELDLDRVVVPEHAGNFSAWGLLTSDVTYTLAQTRITALSDEGLATLAPQIADMFAELDSRVARGVGGARAVHELVLDLRYAGQEHTLSLEVPTSGTRFDMSVAELAGAFEIEYQKTFGVTLADDVEIVNLRPTIKIPLPRDTPKPRPVERNRAVDGFETRPAYSFTRDEWQDFSIVERSRLEPGDVLTGPAIITEPTTTTYVDATYRAEIDGYGLLLITQETTHA